MVRPAVSESAISASALERVAEEGFHEPASAWLARCYERSIPLFGA